ncbi:MAG: DUF1343 domain-containing protein [Spirochaetes bacterium]|jgi:uncharacterized protein YbbC (DUF1343 family)|nr:DUF1343 domain-containing protein [Spirochaetota bacterium]
MKHDELAFRFGLETFLDQPFVTEVPCGDGSSVHLGDAIAKLEGKRVALLAHPASVDCRLRHSVDRLFSSASSLGVRLTALLGPQHGMRGEKQDNMIESSNFTDPATGLPVFSLYGETRRITAEMADHFDVLLVDLQDVGVRVYTFLTTLGYILDDFQQWPDKEVWVLDRANPLGRDVEGLALQEGWESFVGVAHIPMQHGFTLGEFARWYHFSQRLKTNLTLVPMTGWDPSDASAAWPGERVWLQPSPNMPGLHTARAYPGTVMLEGTTLSEGRGTTRPLSVMGHPAVDWQRVLAAAAELDADWRAERRAAGGSPTPDVAGGPAAGEPPADVPEWLFGCRIRPVTFQPTFHKHAGTPTPGIEIVAEGAFYDPAWFSPYRLVAAILRSIRRIHPDLKLWTDPPYEYEYEKTPIDVITGGTRLREWVEDLRVDWTDFESMLQIDEDSWRRASSTWHIY